MFLIQDSKIQDLLVVMTHEDLLKENLSETFEFVFKFSLMFPRKLVREKG